MKKIFPILLILCLLIVGCGAEKRITAYIPGQYFIKYPFQEPIHVPQPKIVPTHSDKLPYPFLHINGFKNYKVKQSKHIQDSNSLFVKEVRFYATYSSFYTRKVMHDKFNNWNKNLFITGDRIPILIWEKVKLLPNRNEFFSVYAGGSKSPSINDTIYSAISVLDSKGNDCLNSKNNPLKEEIISFFAEGIKNLDTSKDFYSKFWGLIQKRKDK